MTNTFDFDTPRSRPYHRSRPRSLLFWVVVTGVGVVFGVVIMLFIGMRFGSPPPASTGDPGIRVRLYLDRVGMTKAEIDSLRIFWYPSPAAARVAASDGPTVCYTWGQWLVLGPPETLRKVRAATEGVEPP